jgi:hypothetical protein
MLLKKILKDRNWLELCKHKKLKESIIEENIKHIRWNVLCKNQSLSEEFLKKHFDKIKLKSWKDVLKRSKPLSTSFLEKLVSENKLNPNNIVFCGKATDDFINNHQDIRWSLLPGKNNLSEALYRKNADKINYTFITCDKNLSDDFLIEFMDKINWIKVPFSRLSMRVLKELAKRDTNFNWAHTPARFTDNQLFSTEFLDLFFSKAFEKYIDKSNTRAGSIAISSYKQIAMHMILSTNDNSFLKRINCLTLDKFERFMKLLADMFSYDEKSLKLIFKNETKYFRKSAEYIKKYYSEDEYKSKTSSPSLILNRSVEYLKEHKDLYFAKNHINTLCSSYRISDRFIKEFDSLINYGSLSNNPYLFSLSDKAFESIADKLNWEYVSRSNLLNRKIMLKYGDKIHWECVRARIPKSLMMKNINNINIGAHLQYISGKDIEQNENLFKKMKMFRATSKKFSLDFIKKNLSVFKDELKLINSFIPKTKQVLVGNKIVRKKTMNFDKPIYSKEEMVAITELFKQYGDLL